MSRKPKEIIFVRNIYYDDNMKFWSIEISNNRFITGFSNKEDAIEYCNKNGYIIKGEI